MTFANPDTSFETEWGQPPLLVLAPLTGTTVTLLSSARYVLLRPAGALAALTIRLPRAPAFGQFVELASTQAITALTVLDGNGNATTGMATSLAANAGTDIVFAPFTALGTGGSWVRWRG